MRILLVNSHGDDRAYGGAERYVALLRDGLERRGVRCSLLSAFPVDEGCGDALGVLHATDWREDPVRRLCDHLDGWRAPVSVRLRAAIRAADVDVVHTHNLFGIATGIWECARGLDIPVVHTLHDYGLLCPRTTLLRTDGSACRPHPLLCGLRTRRQARWAGAVGEAIGVSGPVLAAHRGFFASGTGEHVVHAPIPAPLASPPSPAPALRTLGFIGRLDVHKGVEVLTRAAPGLASLGVRLRIAGEGPLRERVAAAPGIDYVGRVSGSGLEDFLASCDAGVVPSLWAEPGLTFSALEWLGSGRPVLTTGRGGLAELPPAGVVRIAGDAADLVSRVGAMHTGPAWAALSRAVAPVTAAAARADLDRFALEHLRVYERALVPGDA